MTKPNTESDKSIDELLDKAFTKLQLVEIGKDGTNVYSESKPFLSQITDAKAQIHQLVAEARIKGEVDIYSWIISSYEDGEDIENIVSESKTRLSQLTNGEKK